MKKVLPALLCAAMVAAMIAPATAGGRRSAGRSTAHVRRAERRLPALVETHHDALYRRLQTRSLTPARYAFHRARSVFHLRAVKARFGSVRPVPSRDVTLVLRDLKIRLNLLPRKMRAKARQVLARPSVSGGTAFGARVPGLTESHCSANVCYHWSKTGNDAPSLTDSNANGRPDWIDANETTFENVFSVETTQYGYRAPKSDSASPQNLNPNGKIDVYISDLGSQLIYGYCTSDDPANRRDLSAYCAMDDDFSPTQFNSGANGVEALQVTAAHEFFHAVQFAYDIGEDSWWMEATATWMEDELYDPINDNHQYLRTGPMGAPALPLDSFIGFDQNDPNAGYQYGTWIFPRFLEEYSRHFGTGDDPTIIRQIWEKLDASPGAPAQYSTQGIASVLEARGLTLPDMFSGFAAANAKPSVFYEEGADYDSAARAATFTLSSTTQSVPQTTRTIDHLSANVISLKAATGLAGPGLEVTVDLPDSTTGAKATLVSTGLPGPLTSVAIPLDSTGAGTLAVPFGSGVSEVLLVLSNGSASFKNCAPFSDTGTACGGGTPNHDDQAFKFAAAVTSGVSPLPSPTGTPPPSPTPTESPSPEPTPTDDRDPTALNVAFIKDGGTLFIGGQLLGADSGSVVNVTLARKKNGKFRKVGSSVSETDQDLIYVVGFKRPKPGSCKATARYAGDSTHLPSKASKTFKC